MTKRESAPLNLLLMGAPGSGKGTQAGLLFERYGLKQISTGDILRDAKRQGTELGQKAKSYMDAGRLVPDNLIVDLIRDVLAQESYERGWILDGFPRTLPQAEALDVMLQASKTQIHHVVVIDVPEAALLARITGRRSCKNCGRVYHIEFSRPSVAEQCDHCGGPLYQREDDTEEKVRVRLEAYSAQTSKVIPYYEGRGIVIRVDGLRPPAEVLESIGHHFEL